MDTRWINILSYLGKINLNITHKSIDVISYKIVYMSLFSPSLSRVAETLVEVLRPSMVPESISLVPSTDNLPRSYRNVCKRTKRYTSLFRPTGNDRLLNNG